jgi:anti-sigma factor RsiW
MHGTRDQLESYLNDDLDPDARGRLDAHVSTCLPCAFALAEAGAAAARWERRGLLGRLVRVEGPERPRLMAPLPAARAATASQLPAVEAA